MTSGRAILMAAKSSDPPVLGQVSAGEPWAVITCFVLPALVYRLVSSGWPQLIQGRLLQSNSASVLQLALV